MIYLLFIILGIFIALAGIALFPVFWDLLWECGIHIPVIRCFLGLMVGIPLVGFIDLLTVGILGIGVGVLIYQF